MMISHSVTQVQLVRDEEFLGGLISANDQIILSLELYDKLSRSADHDSDDEAQNEPLAAITTSKSAVEKAQERAEAEEAEIAMVQKRLAAAQFEEGELDALQDKQRIRIERHNSYRSARSSTNIARSSNAVHDLMDINFDDGQQPPHAVMSPTSVSSSGMRGNSAQQNASLSDYSEYESESDDEAAAENAGADFVEDSDQYGDSHRPNIGPASLYSFDEEDGGADPFADPQEASSAFPPSQPGHRQGFAAV